MSKNVRKSETKQLDLLLTGGEAEMVPKKAASGVKKADEPATDLMKMVAAKTLNEKNMEKVFTQEEIEDILMRRDSGEALEPIEHKVLKEQYRKMKRFVKGLEKGNKERLILVPSISQGGGFYKVFDFSALYYVYRLADRMGRSAKIMRDTDRFSKMNYAASLVNIEKFVEQFKRFEGETKIEITEDGVYLLTLKRALSDDEVGELRLVEETRREKLHNVLRPKAMEPAVFQAILMVVRQVAPRVKKLDRQYYYAIGEGMLKDLSALLARYFDFANGINSREETGRGIMRLVDNLFAGLAILSEVRVWDYGVAAAIGENINELKRLVMKDFGVKVAKDE